MARLIPQSTQIPAILVRLTVIIIVIQVAQFWVVDRPFSPNNQAIYRYDSDDIIEIALRDDPNPMSRYSALVAIAEIAPHSTIFLPTPGARAETHRYFGFAKAAEVIVVSGVSHDSPVGFDPLPWLVAHGPGAHRGAPWMIALDPTRPGGNPGNPGEFLSEALADGQRGTNPGQPRELVVVRFRDDVLGEPGFADYGYYLLIIETSLLDPTQVRQLTGGADS